MTNTYDTIIIGAASRAKAPVFTRARSNVGYAGIAMYSAEAVPSGIGNLSSSKP
jgi:hypothetical protein